MSDFLTRFFESKAIFALQSKAVQQKQLENKKILDTMIALARIGELTPERYEFFMEILSNQKIGENDVQEHILSISSRRGNTKK